MILERSVRWLRAERYRETFAYLLHNNALPFINFSGTSLRYRSLEEGVAYVLEVADRYRSGARAMGRSFEGARILEIGPGDNLAVAMLLIAWGARSVHCLDRFDCLAEAHASRSIYYALLERLTSDERRRVLNACPWIARVNAPVAGGAIKHVCHLAVEQCDAILPVGTFDCILSNASLEHVKDLRRGIAAMAQLLTADGWMFHEVDLRAHGRYESVHELHFLTVTDWLWTRMTSRVGSPNRYRVNVYREAFEDAGMWVGVDVLQSASIGLATAVWPKVAAGIEARDVEHLIPLVIRLLVHHVPPHSETSR